ncbi:hypothetical protein FOA52_000892 [Chlamydomonas sp. UWO 241]|nr:hypothetical protein FOA52_000892 [Chlamydomonas sp. UWO 241]
MASSAETGACGDNLLAWQARMVPLMYDAAFHHNLQWPTQACRWGERLETGQGQDRYRVFYSEQTDGTEPPKLASASVDVLKPGVCSADVVAAWQEHGQCAYLRPDKVVFHPGEVSKLRELPQSPNLVITHTDSPDLMVWDMLRQRNRARDKAAARNVPSVPELKLTGHTEDALFPLATTTAGPMVASGGGDYMVLVWDLQDSMETVLSCGGSSPSSSSGSRPKPAPELEARIRLSGHTCTVEDVVFCPGSTTQLVSVGDDQMVAFWDTRASDAPTSTISDAHGRNQDIQCVDWEATSGHMLATGAMDGSLRVWDVRRMGAPEDCLTSFSGQHAGGIIRLEWHPQVSGVLASGGEDRLVNVWRAGAGLQQGAALLFQHTGHHRGKVIDFQWCPGEGEAAPWTMLSASDDSVDEEIGGGSLQVWRMSPLIHLSEEKALARLEPHRGFITNGSGIPPSLAPLPKPEPRPEPEPEPSEDGAPDGDFMGDADKPDAISTGTGAGVGSGSGGATGTPARSVAAGGGAAQRSAGGGARTERLAVARCAGPPRAGRGAGRDGDMSMPPAADDEVGEDEEEEGEGEGGDDDEDTDSMQEP